MAVGQTRGDLGVFAVMGSLDTGAIRPENERRQFKRFPLGLAVQAKRDDMGTLAVAPAQERPEASVTIELRDFSLGGLRGASSLALRPDERVTVCMPPFGTRPQTSLTGRVVRCMRQDDRFDVGIEFCQTDADPESSPWLRIPELFYMSGGSPRTIQ